MTITTVEPKLQLWTLTRLGLEHIVIGELHEMTVCAVTADDAREWAVRGATWHNDVQTLVWRSPNEHVVRVSHLGEAEPNQDSGVVETVTWTGQAH